MHALKGPSLWLVHNQSCGQNIYTSQAAFESSNLVTSYITKFAVMQ